MSLSILHRCQYFTDHAFCTNSVIGFISSEAQLNYPNLTIAVYSTVKTLSVSTIGSVRRGCAVLLTEAVRSPRLCRGSIAVHSYSPSPYIISRDPPRFPHHSLSLHQFAMDSGDEYPIPYGWVKEVDPRTQHPFYVSILRV